MAFTAFQRTITSHQKRHRIQNIVFHRYMNVKIYSRTRRFAGKFNNFLSFEENVCWKLSIVGWVLWGKYDLTQKLWHLFKYFKSGYFELKDKERSGQSKKIWRCRFALLDEDSNQTSKQLAKAILHFWTFTGIGKDSEGRKMDSILIEKTLKSNNPLVKFWLWGRNVFCIEFWQVMKSGSISTTQSTKNHGETLANLHHNYN